MDNNIIIIGVLVVVLVIIFISLISFVSRNYIKVPPNKVAVFYGRKSKTQDGTESGFKVVTGGAKFKIPILESVTYLDLNVFSIDIEVREAPNKDGVPITLKGVANVKILSDEASLMAACERFLNMDPEEIRIIAFKNLEGHLRSIAGRLTIEEIVGDRTKLNQEVLADATADLQKLGLGIDLLTIQEVTDKYGYIEQLGRKRTAEVKRDAEIGTAEAQKESVMKTTDANKEAIQKRNENEIAIADSDKLRDVQKSLFSAEVAKQQAIADQAGPLATAQAKQEVIKQETEILRIQTQKETEVATAAALKREQELIAEKIKPSEAERQSNIIKAEANKQVSIVEAEGRQLAIQKLAEAEKQKKSLEGQGEAEAIRAKLLAEAEGARAKGMAEAEVVKAKLLAEAEGLLKKAEAYERLDEAGKMLQILEVVERVLPQSIEKFAGVMAAAAKPFESIDKINIVDFGGSGDKTALSKFGQTAPEMVMKFFSALQATGFDAKGLAKKLGLEPGTFFNNKNESSDEDKIDK